MILAASGRGLEFHVCSEHIQPLLAVHGGGGIAGKWLRLTDCSPGRGAAPAEPSRVMPIRDSQASAWSACSCRIVAGVAHATLVEDA